MGEIQDGDLAAAAETIRENDLTHPELQMALFSSASCSPEAIHYLVDEIGLDPFVELDGETTVYHLVWPRTDDGPRGCGETERVAPVVALLEMGVDPCKAPSGAPEDVPATRSAEWGRTPEMGTHLRAHAQGCTP